LLTDAVAEAPSAAESYAQAAALPLCLSWQEWMTGDRLSQLEGSRSAADTETGPVIEADGKVRVRGMLIECRVLLADYGFLAGGSS
ncbi:MAG: hypothetical protein ABGX61_00520, partial [Acidimicrobiales bacterium]